MKTLVINIKNEKDIKLIKELLSRLDVEIEKDSAVLKRSLGRSKFKSEKDFLSFAGSMKGQLKSKEQLRDLAWRKRS